MMSYQEATEDFIALCNISQPTATRSAEVLQSRVRNMRSFLDFIGSPDKEMKLIHVTGTSGKGTVVSLLHHTLHKEGFNVSSIISPHTTTYLERFLLNDGLTKPQDLIKGIEFIKSSYTEFLKTNPPLSFFGLTLALGLHTAKEVGSLYTIVEASMGGRFDASNAIENPELAIITNVDKDHSKYLGTTLEEIAYHKAGIMKQRATVIVGEERTKLRKVFCDEAMEHDNPLFFVKSKPGEKINARLNHNKLLVIKACEELGISSEKAIENFKTYKPLPCRFEYISKDPVIILDGSHNPAKISATLDLYNIKENKKPIVLFGCGAGKDAQTMINLIAKTAHQIHFTRSPKLHHKCLNPFLLQKMSPQKKRGEAFLDPFKALETLEKNLKRPLLIIGSFYLTGELRKKWVSEEQIIKKASSDI